MLLKSTSFVFALHILYRPNYEFYKIWNLIGLFSNFYLYSFMEQNYMHKRSFNLAKETQSNAIFVKMR